MTLYRKVPGNSRGRKPHPDAFYSDKYGWLESVEPCEHGNYARHVVEESIYSDFVYDNCAGLKEEV